MTVMSCCCNKDCVKKIQSCLFFVINSQQSIVNSHHKMGAASLKRGATKNENQKVNNNNDKDTMK